MKVQTKNISLGSMIRMLIGAGLLSFLPLLVSWRWNWWEGWAFAFLFLGNFVISRALLAWLNPDLVQERDRSLQHENTKPWDKVLAPLMAFGGVLISTVAGVNVRFDSSPAFTLPVQLVALLIILAGFALGTWAMIENRFFSGVVRIQSDRGHRVVSGGPYRWVRHPGYAAVLWVYLAIPFFLNSLWALVPAVLLIVLIFIRTTLEDRFLQEELQGYRAYADRVPHRLLPGIW